MLNLSTGLIYDCLEYAIRKFDGADFRAKVLSTFSGTLCIDEIHLGHRVVLLARDPIAAWGLPSGQSLFTVFEAILRFARGLAFVT